MHTRAAMHIHTRRVLGLQPATTVARLVRAPAPFTARTHTHTHTATSRREVDSHTANTATQRHVQHGHILLVTDAVSATVAGNAAAITGVGIAALVLVCPGPPARSLAVAAAGAPPRSVAAVTGTVTVPGVGGGVEAHGGRSVGVATASMVVAPP